MPRTSQSKPEFSTQAARFAAIRARDPRADGRFYYSVATTGVYCRPSCAARRALAQNVAFHETAAAAERAGFRPCKRCRPTEPSQDERHARLVQSLRARIEASEQPVVLEELAAGAGLSPFYLHRLFKKHVGMTPREYAAACRLQRVGDGLRAGATVTSAIHDAGYSSSSRFYEVGGSALGITPSDLRRGASGVELRATVRGCSLGYVLIAVTSRGVCAISFGEDAVSLLDELRERFPRATVHGSDARLEALADKVVVMVDSAGVATDLPLDLLGTAFQQRVWRALRDIPRGSTSTYAEVAARIGAPHAARAVGTACGKNPVAVAVPCHRVVRDDGSLGGYRWGLHRKKALLDRERTR
jgi:AraC family transcriptional regulator of adaptative response/methylated-DNA-[protein]-cysteine methyltransferase